MGTVSEATLSLESPEAAEERLVADVDDMILDLVQQLLAMPSHLDHAAGLLEVCPTAGVC